jgi:GNAT superfamily N-acetyltransferase
LRSPGRGRIGEDECVIRRITTDDVDTYRDIRLRALRDAPSAFASTYDVESRRPRDAWVERVALCARGGSNAVFLAFGEDGTCIGLAGGKDDDLGADRQLISMWVEPSQRGTRVAAELVDAVVAWAEAHGATSIGLWVTRDNERAQRFYERMGFVATGDVQPLPSDPCKDELRMVRALSATGMCS